MYVNMNQVMYSQCSHGMTTIDRLLLTACPEPYQSQVSRFYLRLRPRKPSSVIWLSSFFTLHPSYFTLPVSVLCLPFLRGPSPVQGPVILQPSVFSPPLTGVLVGMVLGWCWGGMLYSNTILLLSHFLTPGINCEPLASRFAPMLAAQ